MSRRQRTAGFRRCYILFLFSVAFCCYTTAFGQPELKQPPVDPYRPSAIQTENVPAIPLDLLDRYRQYQNVRTAGFRGWAPDGRGILVATRFGETTQLHRVYEPGGRRVQVTFFSEPVDGRFLPKDSENDLVVTMSAGGNEAYQVFHVDGASGRAEMITDGKSRNLPGPILYDGSRMIIAGTARNGRDTDLFIADPRKPGSLRPIFETDGEFWTAEDWSRDRFHLLLNRYVSINETYPAVLDIVTGEKTAIPRPAPQPPTEPQANRTNEPAPGVSATDGSKNQEAPTGPVINPPKTSGNKPPYKNGESIAPAAFGPMKFSLDGKSIYAATDALGEFRNLARIDRQTTAYHWLTLDVPWNVDDLEVDEAGGSVAFTVNENGASALYLIQKENPKRERRVFTPGRKKTDGPKPETPVRIGLPLGIVSSMKFSPDGGQLGFTLARPDAPADAYSLDLKSRELVRWTYSEVGGLDASRFVTPTQVLYESFDGRKIPAWYFRPETALPGRPAPVVINIHGGPESQYRPYFSPTDQFYLNEMGVAVLRPNVRGSAGYGKTYLLLDNADKREDSVKDIGALLDWIKTRPELDENRVAVMGGSYGGYMVLSSLTHFPERIRAGVDVVGIASFTTFLKNTSAYRRDLRRAEYGDERDAKMQAVFDRINPTANAGKIRSALLVAHGKNDPRVPFSEAEQIVEKVRTNNVDVWTIYAENEGHGFRKKANRDYLNAAIAMFLVEHLAKE